MPVDDADAWLLATDPALRWQVERDLLGAPPQQWQATRRRIAQEGFGARLLDLQGEDGMWAGGAYFPGGFFEDPANQDLPGQPWTATTWSLTALREWGMDPAPLRENGAVERLARHARWEYDDLPYWGGEVDCCINAMTLANGLWLGAEVGAIADWLLAHQLEDGGWNCDWVEGSQRSSFHSTINALGGLLALEEATGGTQAVRAARRRGEEYLLRRHLHRRLSTGESVGPFVDRFRYPFRWEYSVLRALDHLRRASALDGTAPDPRAGEAIGMVRAARQEDGTWLQGPVLPGAVWFAVDVPEAEPSPWLTLHARRVLDWWEA
ncbi:squalene cyclase [Brachybacterium phenoliresistens]|uniref:squalene cyclase n=1 Tax=Brachybacterium phenoliresistens TaxID=396014 RepID=UPI0031D81B24